MNITLPTLLNGLDITAVNREAAHTAWRALENESQALAYEVGKEDISRYISSLNGIYQFKLYQNCLNMYIGFQKLLIPYVF